MAEACEPPWAYAYLLVAIVATSPLLMLAGSSASDRVAEQLYDWVTHPLWITASYSICTGLMTKLRHSEGLDELGLEAGQLSETNAWTSMLVMAMFAIIIVVDIVLILLWPEIVRKNRVVLMGTTINCIACSAYFVKLHGAELLVSTSYIDGRKLSISRHIVWNHTISLMCALLNSLTKVSPQRACFRVLLAFQTIQFGFIGQADVPPYLQALFLTLSEVALDWLCVAIWYSLRGERRFSWQRCVLGMFVFTTWHVFPLICVIVWLDLVDDSGEFRLYAFADILAKVLITTTMLQGHVKVASDTLVLDYKIVHAEHEIMQDDMIEMISASPVPIIVTNSLGKITVWNRQAATVSRLKANAAEGVIIWDLPSLDPASGTSAYAAIQKVLKPNIGDKQHCITVTFELRFDHSTSDSSLSALGPSSTGISPVPGSHLNTKGRDRVTRTPTTVLLVTASATRNAAGEVVGIICLCADMTAECERLLAETSRAQVEAVNDAKDKFLACMSHEMRTPLSALIGLLQLVNAKPEPDWTHAVLHPFILSSLRSAEHLHVLVSDVLDMSKVSQGKLSLIIREFDLLETLESIADRCRHVLAQVGAGKRQLELEVRTDPDLSLAGSLRVLRGDAQRIQQVLTNLGSNAIKYTMRGSVEIHVIVRPLNEEELDEEEKMVAEAASYAPRECVPVELCVRVKDTGIGIPKHALKRIFDLFETASGEFFTNSGSGLSSASGIGLTICKELVNAMGGTLYVKSTLGSGSTFTFKLKTLGFSNGPSTQPIPFLPPSLRGSPPPLPPPRSWIEPKLSPSSSEEKTGAFTAPLAPGRLVLAEDDEMNRVVISMFLEGHTVTEAHNGLEAIVSVYRELQSQQGVDLVVMDINMPLLTGRQASQLIRLMQFGVSPWAAHIPIIALTANAMDSDLRRCLNAGMTTCLTKPVPLEMLLRLVRSSLRNCRQTDFQGEEVQVPDEDQKTHIEAMLPLIREVVALTVAALVHGVGVRLDMPERVESLSGCLAWCLRLLGNEEGASKIDEAMGQGEEETELRLKALAVECGQEWLNFSSYGGP